jgi:hypothetical protein
VRDCRALERILMSSYCSKHPHMVADQLEKTRTCVGDTWVEHYGMLCAASDGCVQTQKKWNKYKLLDRRQQLIDEAQGGQSSQQSADNKSVENQFSVVVSEDVALYRKKVVKFHEACFEGQTEEARRLWHACPNLLWETSQVAMTGKHMRASDYIRMGRYSGEKTYSLYQELFQAEEKELMSAFPGASTFGTVAPQWITDGMIIKWI